MHLEPGLDVCEFLVDEMILVVEDLVTPTDMVVLLQDMDMGLCFTISSTTTRPETFFFMATEMAKGNIALLSPI